jgi:predicted nucleic acid-binding protein
MRLLDTDILIDLLRIHPPTLDWLATLMGPFAVPGFAALELYHGCKNKKEVRDVDKLLKPMQIVWPSPQECRNAGKVFPALHLSANMGILDALIAACAVGAGATLCTFNVKHFKNFPGLSVEQPYPKA